MSDRQIIESIQAITGTRLTDKTHIAACNVESIDIPSRNCVCTLIDGKTESLITVSLMAEVDDGLLIIPSIDSTIHVLFSDFISPFVVQFSAIDQIIINGGDLGGMVKLIDLVTKLNNIENLLNDLITKFNVHTHIGVSPGSGSTGPTPNVESGNLALTVRNDIENVNFLQGL